MTKLLGLACICMGISGMAQAGDPADQATAMEIHMNHAAHMEAMAGAQRQAEVSERGREVMPFDLGATIHVFTKTSHGGIQKVLARRHGDAKQVALVRQHLKEIQGQFLQGDFSGPSHIHGEDMPGLADLATAKPGQIKIDYLQVKNGAQLKFTAMDSHLIAAIHRWFDAQASDHGKDAKYGHDM